MLIPSAATPQDLETERHDKRTELRRAALEYHEFPTPGKIAICATKQLTNQRDLALAYSPGVGPHTARIMLVGEQPGDQEDLAGLPFVGPAGALLEQALREAGVARDSLYLTNAVKHFKWEPRGKRRLHKTPAQREILACHGWLEEEIERVQPRVIVALGSTALKSILQDGAASMTPLLGTPVQHDGRWVVTVYHPAYVLRAPDEASRRQAYRVIVEGLRQASALLRDEHYRVVAGTSSSSSRRA